MKCLLFAVTVFLTGFLGCTSSQENASFIDTSAVQDRVASELANIPELNGLNTSALPTLEETKNLFKKKCSKNGGPNAFDNASQAQGRMERCLKSLINMTELQAEMEEAKPHGDLDIVFKKYCGKRHSLRSCVTDFTNAVEPCFDEKEKENSRIILNITDSLLDFICFKEGDRIAIFISTKGPECFQSRQDEIKTCVLSTVNSTFGNYLPMGGNAGMLPDPENLPPLAFGNKECSDMSSLQTCVVKNLETCKDPTPANIVDSIFNFIKKGTPCKDILADHSVADGNGNAAVAHLTESLLVAVSMLLTLRFV